MKKKLLILGDSGCHGIGTVSEFKDPANAEFSFGKHLADFLDLDYVNLSEPGINSQRIIELGYDYIQKNKDTIDRVIIGWTSDSRAGFYSNNDLILQILPGYIHLGKSLDNDVFVDFQNDVKFITDKNHKHYLGVLPDLHKIFVEGDFLNTLNHTPFIDGFRSWLREQNLNFFEFDVFYFTNYTSCPLNLKGKNKYSHLTKEEQKQFAEQLFSYFKEIKWI